MADLLPVNGYGERSSPTQLADGTLRVQATNSAPVISNSRRKRARPALRPSLPSVSLVIPVRNEARNIAWVLEQIADDVSEIILVDGNSSDATLITARSYRPDIRVVPQEGVGKGSALRTGFLAAAGDIIVMMDADGSMAPQEIRHYLHFLTNGYDFVKGSRFIVGGGSLDITTFRRLGNRFLLAVFNTLYDADLTDLCYGFCAFHRRYLELLALSATGFEIEAEMTVRAMQAGLRIAEVPSLEMPRRAGRSNLHAIRDGWRVLNTVLGGRRHQPYRPAARTQTKCPHTERRRHDSSAPIAQNLHAKPVG
jgi:glycosyltransferase involved in cell wall biosynthesis